MSNIHKGSSFDNFLEEEGLLDDAVSIAVKRVIANQVTTAMQAQQLTKSKMADKMHTSRAALNRLLDPENMSVTLSTLIKAAHVLGKRVDISFSDR